MGPSNLAYSLEGSDAKYFNIDDMGQITVGRRRRGHYGRH